MASSSSRTLDSRTHQSSHTNPAPPNLYVLLPLLQQARQRREAEHCSVIVVVDTVAVAGSSGDGVLVVDTTVTVAGGGGILAVDTTGTLWRASAGAPP